MSPINATDGADQYREKTFEMVYKRSDEQTVNELIFKTLTSGPASVRLMYSRLQTVTSRVCALCVHQRVNACVYVHTRAWVCARFVFGVSCVRSRARAGVR